MIAFKNYPTAAALVLGLGLLFAPGHPTLAQTPNDNPPAATASYDSTLVSAIAPYRDDVRRSVLLVSQQPQALTKLAQQQASSQQAFATLIQLYGQNKQSWFYDIARYPDVLHELATLPDRSNKSVGREITQTLPAESQLSAWKLYRHHHSELVQADRINQLADQTVDSLLTPFNQSTQQAFRQLISMPDVLMLLVQEIDKTIRMGQAYQADSAGLVSKLATLHDSLTVQNQRELADYRRELNQDPLAQQELQQAGQAYAQANGYYKGINPNPDSIDSLYYYQNPYSFWSGYPSWSGSSFWFPSAWWAGPGFYYGPAGNMVLFGLPSPGFSNWFFTRGYGLYPHLCSHFNAYYARNIGRHHFWSAGHTGFMSMAHRTFGLRSDVSSGRSNWLTNPRHYSRPYSWSGSGSGFRSTSSASRYHASPSPSYHAPSRSGGFSHTRSFSSGSHSHSGGFHSSSGGHHSSGHR